MAMIKCPECSKDISDRASSCPNCGLPLQGAAISPQASTSLQNLANKEYSFFQDGTINITNLRAIFPGRTYAMANITSVSMGIIPPRRGIVITFAIIGLLCAILSNGNSASVIVGIIILTSAIAAWFIMKPIYSVRIGSASGENDGISSKDKQYVEKIVAAMNDAIIKRG